MRKNSIYILAILVLALSGCRKEEVENQDNDIVKYAVVLGNGPQSKGTLVNTSGSDASLSDFTETVKGFKVSAYNGAAATALFSQTLNWSGSAWVADPVAFWPQATKLTFYAYANLPATGSSVTPASAGQTLTHTVPVAAIDQKDILLGYYKGSGGNTGMAEILFSHPLTAVVFKDAGLLDGKIVKSITLSGIGLSGSTTMDADGAIGDWNVTGYNGTASQSKEGGLTVKDDVIGEPFIIIPQNAGTYPITVMVEMTDGTTMESTIGSGVLEAGKTNVFSISVSAVHWLDITYVSPWDVENTI